MSDMSTIEHGAAEPPVHSPAEIEEWAELVRRRIVRQPPRPGTVKTPDSIIEDLEHLKYAAGQNVVILREAERMRSAARRALARAQAAAQRTAREEAKTEKLTVDEKAARVEELTEALADAVEVAEIAYNYARRVAELTESAKSTTQTQSKQVEITYALAGSRRGA
ncbi:hypothetical protein [Microbacterium sp. No. 7]|uniref:hypothetical protein n=1 Tax=Microbacterium sp. No. 7 TaxID=1714373 RepID=UPI0006ED0221|nr:hypothetical protein [Microbacterium sp. No. 7]ALJ20399.1 hypothetical protein AOA12_10965 [Microbacterium sp. No. 7]